MIIRAEKAADISQIHALTKLAFLDAPHSGKNEHLIVDALRDANALTISMVAEKIVNGRSKIVGHVAVSPVTISDGSEHWFGLGPISVTPESQNMKIGSRLMERAIEELKAIDATGCVLLGNPDYYSRFGFRANDLFVLEGVPAEYFQTLALKPNQSQGKVGFHEAFSTSE